MDRLTTGASLGPGSSLRSENDRVRLDFQTDGNVVLYRNDNNWSLWNTATHGKPSDRLTMQSDGNLVLYQRGGNAIWASHTQGHTDCVLVLQNDGNLVIYDASNRPVWASNTLQNWNILMIPPQRLDLGSGHFIVTDAELDPVNKIATFHMTETCTNKVFGFTAGVKLLYYDAHNRLIGESGTLQYGINQAPIVGANHRSETWNGHVPAGTVSFALSQFSDAHNRFGLIAQIGDAILSGFEDIGSAIADAASAASNWCSQDSTHKDICMGAAFAIAVGAVAASGGTASLVIVLPVAAA